MRLINKLPALVGIALVSVVVFAACSETKSMTERQKSVALRGDSFEQAVAQHPNPRPRNFPAREALVEFTERTDLIDHPFYVYILGDNGNVIGYYVAKTRPINSCAFLGSTEEIYGSSYGNLVLTAPSLDGIYYGGGGASAGCDEWFFFDPTSDALIEIRGVKFFTADQPLSLKAEPILVERE